MRDALLVTDPDVEVAHGTSGVNDDKSACPCLTRVAIAAGEH